MGSQIRNVRRSCKDIKGLVGGSHISTAMWVSLGGHIVLAVAGLCVVCIFIAIIIVRASLCAIHIPRPPSAPAPSSGNATRATPPMATACAWIDATTGKTEQSWASRANTCVCTVSCSTPSRLITAPTATPAAWPEGTHARTCIATIAVCGQRT